MIGKLHTTFVLALLALGIAGCDRSPSAPEIAYPDLAGLYSGAVQYGCGFAGLPYGEDMPLAIEIRQEQGRLQGTWTEVVEGLVREHRFSGFIEVGAIRIVFEDDPDLRIRCYFDVVPSYQRTEITGEGFYVTGADNPCLRFSVASPTGPIDAGTAGNRGPR